MALRGASESPSRDWSFKDGFVRPAKLRLWKESMGMSDYQLEFAGEIEQKGLGWAYRAKDFRNYYANKIVITKPGPLCLWPIWSDMLSSTAPSRAVPQHRCV